MGFKDFFKKKDDLQLPPLPPKIAREELKKELPTFPEKKVMPTFSEKASPKFVSTFESRVIKKEQKAIDEWNQRKIDTAKPIFIYTDKFRKILDSISESKGLLKEQEDIIDRIDDHRDQINKIYENWNKELKSVQQKIIYSEKKLFKVM